MNVIIYARNFNPEVSKLNVQYEVERYSHAAIGGPKSATIEASGNEVSLWGLIERLRCPIEIWSDLGDCVWWGMINTVVLDLDGISIGVSLDSMSNKIAVAYNLVVAGSDIVGERMTTYWMENAESVLEYGIKELLQTTSGTTSEHALAALAMLLDQKKYPIPTIQWGGGEGKAKVTLECKGWFDTLDWMYYSHSAGLEFYESSGAEDQVLGAAAGNTKIAQGFILDERWIVKGAQISIKAVGTPVDDVIVDICLDDSGAPDTVLISGTLPNANIGTDAAWEAIVLDGDISLAENTLYWLVVRRSGAVDAVNYFEVDVNEELGYVDGDFRIFDGTNYIARDPDADMLFRLTSTEDTANQVKNIAETCGQFFSDVDQDIISGLEISQYRDGDATALYELTELLKMGTINFRRMLAKVDRTRVLRIYEEPLSTTPNFLMQNGDLRSPFDQPLRKEICPAGIWARIKDVMPQTVDITKLADPTLVFIEENEYDVKKGTLNPSPRGVENPFDLARVSDG